MYLAWLVDDPIIVRGKPRKRKASAISRAATGILFMRQAQGAPLMRHKNDAIAETLSGIRRKLGVAVQQKLPVTGDDLRLIARTYDVTKLQDARNLAIVLLGWYAANRRSEVVGLDVADVVFEASGMRLQLRRSKTDQEGAGLEKGVRYAKNPAVCAVRALRRWLDMAKIEDGPLFRGFTRTGQLRASRLSDQVVADVVKDACRRIDLDPERYAGHSLRSGFATTAANKGISLRKIMDQTGHKSERVALGYIRRAELLGDDNPTGGLIE
jgi:integrase